MAPEQQQAVALHFVPELQATPSARVEAEFVSVGAYGSLDAFVVGPNGQRQRSNADDAGWDWITLKKAMTDEHGSWYSSTLTIEPDLSYEFTYNYTDDPSDKVEEGIVRDLWIQDAELYPRPWAEIPDWHPVKHEFTQDTWTAHLNATTATAATTGTPPTPTRPTPNTTTNTRTNDPHEHVSCPEQHRRPPTSLRPDPTGPQKR
ncbi:MAG: hypothetical protein QM638_10370 [Nocardioides sp.]|uniref:hypothetical protein n=1 Tax=Nocardioides sp. TaxID=35761 RepID=UPI0039E5D5CC